jgi:hypothetical protein
MQMTDPLDKNKPQYGLPAKKWGAYTETVHLKMSGSFQYDCLSKIFGVRSDLEHRNHQQETVNRRKRLAVGTLWFRVKP